MIINTKPKLQCCSFSPLFLSSSFRASYRISISAGKSFYKLFHPRCFGALSCWWAEFIVLLFVLRSTLARWMFIVFQYTSHTLSFECGAPHIEELCQLSATSCCAEKCNNFFFLDWNLQDEFFYHIFTTLYVLSYLSDMLSVSNFFSLTSQLRYRSQQIDDGENKNIFFLWYKFFIVHFSLRFYFPQLSNILRRRGKACRKSLIRSRPSRKPTVMVIINGNGNAESFQLSSLCPLWTNSRHLRLPHSLFVAHFNETLF